MPTSLAWMQYEDQDRRRNTEDETYFYCPQVFSRGTSTKVQIELLVLNPADTIYHPLYSWTRGLYENWCHDSKKLISFQTPVVSLSAFRGNGCDVCTRTSVSTVKCFLPARNLQHRIALLKLHHHQTGKEHRETKSFHTTLISQPKSQRELLEAMEILSTGMTEVSKWSKNQCGYSSTISTLERQITKYLPFTPGFEIVDWNSYHWQ